MRGIAVLVLLCSVTLVVAVPSVSAPAGLGRWESRAPMLTERTEVAGAAVGNKIYVVGGFIPGGMTGALEEYDVPTNTWRSRAPLPVAAHHAVMVAIGSRVFVLGGFVDGWTPSNGVWEYDPAADRWTARAPMSVARGGLAAAVLAGRVYVFSGTGPAQAGAGQADTPVTEEYDPAANTWRRRAPIPTPRNHHAAVAVAGKIYTFVGRGGGRNINVTEIYDPATDTWTAGAPIPTARSGIAAAAVGGRIYVFGGELGRPTTYPENEMYDPATNTWSARASMPTPRHGLAAVTVGDRIYVTSGGPRPGGSFSNANEAFIPEEGR